MGWGRYLLMGNLGQQLDIEESRDSIQRLQSVAARNGRETMEVSDRIKFLERDLPQIRLVLACLVEHLVAKGLATREELAQLADRIDPMDGKADGEFEGKIDLKEGPSYTPPAPPADPLAGLKKAVEDR
jgi:hypothetical protein